MIGGSALTPAYARPSTSGTAVTVARTCIRGGSLECSPAWALIRRWRFAGRHEHEVLQPSRRGGRAAGPRSRRVARRPRASCQGAEKNPRPLRRWSFANDTSGSRGRAIAARHALWASARKSCGAMRARVWRGIRLSWVWRWCGRLAMARCERQRRWPWNGGPCRSGLTVHSPVLRRVSRAHQPFDNGRAPRKDGA